MTNACDLILLIRNGNRLLGVAQPYQPSVCQAGIGDALAALAFRFQREHNLVAHRLHYQCGKQGMTVGQWGDRMGRHWSPVWGLL